MTAPPFNSNRTALRRNLKANNLSPRSVFEAIDNEGVSTNLKGEEATIALAALFDETDPWEHLWAYVGPGKFVMRRFRYRLGWYTVNWDEDEWDWMPTTESPEGYHTYASQHPPDLPTVSREEQLNNETDHIDGVGRTVTGIDRTATPDVLSAIMREIEGDMAAPRMWIHPDEVGDKYHLTYDIVAWTGDDFGLSGEWKSVDKLNGHR